MLKMFTFFKLVISQNLAEENSKICTQIIRFMDVHNSKTDSGLQKEIIQGSNRG